MKIGYLLETQELSFTMNLITIKFIDISIDLFSLKNFQK